MAAAMVRAASFAASVRQEASGNGAATPLATGSLRSRRKRVGPNKSLIIRTESNVRRAMKRIPDEPCLDCKGSGIENCSDCRGKGRINHVDEQLLPKGEWPKWCRRCGGRGVKHCERCVGSGEFRGDMGFMYENIEELQNNKSDTLGSIPADLINFPLPADLINVVQPDTDTDAQGS